MSVPKTRLTIRQRCVAALIAALLFGVGSYSQAAVKSTKAKGGAGESIALKGKESVADALQSRTDLSFQNIRINGGSGGSLKNIPANMVEHVEVLQSVTPDMDADSRGGSLRLKTKPTFMLNKPYGEIFSEFRHLSVSGRIERDTGFFINGPMGEDRRFGYRLAGSIEDDLDREDTYRASWTRKKFNDGIWRMAPTRQSIDTFKKTGYKYSFNTGLDYKLTDRVYIVLNSSVYERRIEEERLSMSHELSQGKNATYLEQGGRVEGAAIKYRSSREDNSQEKFEYSVGGRYKYDLLDVDFVVSREKSDTKDLGDETIDFVQKGLDYEYKNLGDGFLVFSYDDPEQATNPENFVFEDVNIDNSYFPELSDRVELNAKYDINLGDVKNYVKVGMKRRGESVDRSENDEFYDDFVGDYRLSDVWNPNAAMALLDGTYRFDGSPSPDLVEKYYLENESDFVLNLTRTHEGRDPYSYYALEEVDATYFMVNSQWDKLRLLWGWRGENTSLRYKANEEILYTDSGDYLSTRSVEGSSSYRTNLPGVHFQYKHTGNLKTSGAWTRTVKRPNFNRLVPFRKVDYEREELDEGNPELLATMYTNLDFTVDWRYSNTGNLKVDLFHKKIEGTVYNQETIVTSGQFKGFLRERPENSGTGEMAGLKLAFKQKLDDVVFVPNGVSLNVTYSFTDSEAVYPSREEDVLPVAYTPEHRVNASVRYQKNALDCQLSYAYADYSLRSVTSSAERDYFNNERVGLNFRSSYRMNDRVKLELKLNSITGAPSGNLYQGIVDRRSYYQLEDRSMSLGVRYRL